MKHLALAGALALALSGCASSNLTGPVQAMPHIVVTPMNDNKPPLAAKQKTLWVDPSPVPGLAESAARRLSMAGYRVTEKPEDADATLRFDGYFWALSADRRKMLTVKLENWPEREQRMRFMQAANEPGVARRTLDRVTDVGLSGNISSPAHLLLAATLGLAMEGAASLAGLRGGGEEKTSPVAAEPAPSCTRETPCDSADLIKRYGVQSVTLGLDWQDQAGGKTRLAVKAEAIAQELIPDRLVAEAASRLLSMYAEAAP